MAKSGESPLFGFSVLILSIADALSICYKSNETMLSHRLFISSGGSSDTFITSDS
jgi:hypothetical protein